MTRGEEKSEKEKDEEVEVQNTEYYKNNYGYFLRLGMFIWYNKLQIVGYVVTSLIHVAFGITACVLILDDDFGGFTELAHVTVLLAMVAIGTSTVRKERFEKIIRNFEKGLQVYGDTLDEDTLRGIEEIRRVGTRRMKFRTIFMIVGLIATAIAIFGLRPIYDWYSGTFDQEDVLRYNVNRYLPVSFWYPVSLDKLWVLILSAVFELYLIIQSVFSALASVVALITTSEELCMELSTLHLTLRNLIKRAEKVGNGRVDRSNLRDCLKRCVIHHCNIIENFDLFHQFYNLMIGNIVTFTTYLICLGAFLLTLEVTLNIKLAAAAYVVFEIFHLLIYCYYGEEMQSLSEDVHYEAYNCDWVEHRVHIKTYLVLIQLRAFHPLKMSSSGLIFLNLNTFGNVCSSAYSYFNILIASK